MLIVQDCTAIDIYIGWNWFDDEMGEKRIYFYWHNFFKLLWKCKTPQHIDRACPQMQRKAWCKYHLPRAKNFGFVYIVQKISFFHIESLFSQRQVWVRAIMTTMPMKTMVTTMTMIIMMTIFLTLIGSLFIRRQVRGLPVLLLVETSQPRSQTTHLGVGPWKMEVHWHIGKSYYAG